MGFEALELVVADEPFRMEITHPKTGAVMRDKAGNPAYIDVIGLDDPRLEDFKRKLFEKAQASNGRLRANYDQVKARSAEFLAEVTVGWYLVDFAGEPIDNPWSKDAARRLFENPKLGWLREQVDAAAGDKNNFLKDSPTS